MSLLAWNGIIEKLVSSQQLRIILASASPRRKEILGSLLLSDKIFTTETSGFEETLAKSQFSRAGDYALATATGKAKDVAKRIKSPKDCITLVIGGDTVVDLNNTILEKPADEEDAKRVLRELSGKSHQVHTGIIIVAKRDGEEDGKVLTTFVTSTEVRFAKLAEESIQAYVATKEPMDKAGSYGIQGVGKGLVESVNGDYFNVVGFPCFDFCEHFSKVLSDLFPNHAPTATNKRLRKSE